MFVKNKQKTRFPFHETANFWWKPTRRRRSGPSRVCTVCTLAPRVHRRRNRRTGLETSRRPRRRRKTQTPVETAYGYARDNVIMRPLLSPPRRTSFESSSHRPRLCRTLNTRRRSRVSVLVYECTHFRFGSIRFFSSFFFFFLLFHFKFPTAFSAVPQVDCNNDDTTSNGRRRRRRLCGHRG